MNSRLQESVLKKKKDYKNLTLCKPNVPLSLLVFFFLYIKKLFQRYYCSNFAKKIKKI